MSTTYPTTEETEREAAIEAATLAIRRGELIVMPTDTVYGVAADAFDPAAVRSLLAAKGRGRDMPPPVLIAKAATAQALGTNLAPYVHALIKEFWPGGLTLICTQQPSLRWDLGDARGTVGIRMPDDEVALAILERTGPLAVSSANRTGQAAATDVTEAEEMLGDRIEVYVDAGSTTSSAASTIVDVTGDRPRLVRPGSISVEEIDAVLAEFELTVADED